MCFTHIPMPDVKTVKPKPRRLMMVKTESSNALLAGALIFLGFGVLAVAILLIALKGNEKPSNQDNVVQGPPARDRAREWQEEVDRQRQSKEEEWILRRKQELEARRQAQAETPEIKETELPPLPQPHTEPNPEKPAAPASVDVETLKKALELLSTERNVAVREHAAAQLSKALETPYPKKDLAIVARILLDRSPLDSGLACDRVHVKSPKVELVYEGVFENATKDYVPLRLRSGALVSASRSFQEQWTFQPPEGAVLADCRIKFEPDSPTREGTLLSAHFAAFPPSQWIELSPGDHIKAGRKLFEAVSSSKLPPGQAIGLLRILAASHVAAALSSQNHLVEAESLLKSSGFVDKDGIWLSKEDVALLPVAAALRAGQLKEAAGFSALERTFRVRYLDFVLNQLRMPMSKDEIPSLLKALGSTIELAPFGAQSRHMSALIDELGKLKVCTSCKGEHRIPCDHCKAKGQVKFNCGSCNGRGIVFVPGPGGGDKTCGACNGSGDAGVGNCPVCKGEGSRICKSCDAPYSCPSAEDVGAWKTCTLCSAIAFMGDRIGHVCSRCFGLGSVLLPSKNKAAELR